MPEAPEVRVVAQYLDFYLCDVPLQKLTVIGGKFLKTPPTGMSLLKYPLTFQSVKSKGKMLIFSFKDTFVKIFIGLGMTGRFEFEQSTHSALRFDLEMPAPFSCELFFTDIRRFGNVTISETDLSEKLAPSVLDGIPEELFLSRARKLNTSRDVTSVLLDQNAVCSGIGNYLLAEILYHAKVNPFRTFKSLTTDELREILQWGMKVTKDAVKERGTSVSDFFLPDGSVGNYQKHLHVYSRTVTPKGEPVKREKGSHGRSIWWVPSVQR